MRPGGDWDYKEDYPADKNRYSPFGNLNFGATGAALFSALVVRTELSNEILYKGAGDAETQKRRAAGKRPLIDNQACCYMDELDDTLAIWAGIQFYWILRDRGVL